MSTPSSGGGGSSVLKILVIIGIVLLLACGGLCGGCLYLAKQGADVAKQGLDKAIQQAKLNAAYQTTRDAVRSDPQVIERLGESLEFTEPHRQGEGDLKPSGETFQMDVKGSKGTAIVSGVATGSGGKFTVTTISVKLPDGTTLDVKPPSEQFDPNELKIDSGEAK